MKAMRRITKRQRKSCESDIESFSLSFGDDIATLGILEGGARREAVGGMSRNSLPTKSSQSLAKNRITRARPTVPRKTASFAKAIKHAALAFASAAVIIHRMKFQRLYR